MGDLIVLAISCILINNILLAQYLGNCPFLGTSKKMETALGMAMAAMEAYRFIGRPEGELALAQVAPTDDHAAYGGEEDARGQQQAGAAGQRERDHRTLTHAP